MEDNKRRHVARIEQRINTYILVGKFEGIEFIIGQFTGSHGDEYEDDCLLGFCTV
jgi:hypothetical protein